MRGSLWGLVNAEPDVECIFDWLQFILDLEFLSLVAKNGNFLSRTVFQAITEQEERMKDAYMVSGADLDRYVPTYYSFVEALCNGLCACLKLEPEIGLFPTLLTRFDANMDPKYDNSM